MCTKSKQHTLTEQLSPRGICFSRWFGKLGNSLIVFRLKRCPLLPEAGGILNRFSLLCRLVFPSLKELYFNCHALPSAGLFLPHAVRKSDSRIRQAFRSECACTHTDTQAHVPLIPQTKSIFMRLINICVCAKGKHRKEETHSRGYERSRSDPGLITLDAVIFSLFSSLLFFFVFHRHTMCSAKRFFL